MSSAAARPARPAWAANRPAVELAQQDEPKPAENAIDISVGMGSLVTNVRHDLLSLVGPSGYSARGPRITGEKISARYDDDGDELWICRHTILTHTDGTKTYTTKWYTFAAYLQTDLERWGYMEAVDVWALPNNENRCYDGDATDWGARRLNKNKIIALWKEHFS